MGIDQSVNDVGRREHRAAVTRCSESKKWSKFSVAKIVINLA